MIIILLLVFIILFDMTNKIDLVLLKLLKGFSKKCVYRYFVIDTKGYNEDKYFIFIRKLRI